MVVVKDFAGLNIRIGDRVAFAPAGAYAGICIGVIEKITSKQIGIRKESEVKGRHMGHTTSEKLYYTYSNQVLIIDRFKTTQPTNELEHQIDKILSKFEIIEFSHIRHHEHDSDKLKQQIIAIISAHDKEIDRQARIDELRKTHDYIDDTYMIITNDLPALLEQDRVFKIRKNHKDEIHKNIDKRLSSLKDSKNE